MGKNTYIKTWSGQEFHFDAPENYKYIPKEIAYVLSGLCRFTGHTNPFYSVLDHSILVYQLILDHTKDEELAILGLLHDAHETYTGDINTPLANFLCKDKIEKLKNSIQEQIELSFLGIYKRDEEIEQVIKKYDTMAFQIEMCCLINKFDIQNDLMMTPLQIRDRESSIELFLKILNG